MSSSDFHNALHELIDAAPEPVDHPSPDRWIAYHRGELSAGEEARLQEHLARCRDCFDLAAGAAAFAQPDEAPDKAGETEDEKAAALWRLLRPQLDPPRQNVRDIASSPRRRSWGSRLPMALAASFFLALLGLAGWNLQLQGALEELRSPKPDALVFDFSAGERLPDSGERTLAASSGPWLLVFHPSEDLPAYRLALRNAATGGELWSYELKPDEDLALTLQLPEGLPPGRYRFEVSGSGGIVADAGKVLETFTLRVTEPGRGE